jgi:hypothetical protein
MIPVYLETYIITKYKDIFISSPLQQFEIIDNIGFNLKIFN